MNIIEAVSISFGEFFNVTQPCRMVNKTTVLDYYTFMKNNKNIKDITMRTRMSGLRAFLYFCMSDENQFIEKFDIKLRKTPRKIKIPYTDEELQRLLKKPNLRDCDFVEYRDWVLVNFFFSTGFRLNTVRNIKISDIDLQAESVALYVTKNGDQNILPLSQTIVKLLREYMIYRSEIGGEYLFCSTRGDREGDILSSRGMQGTIANYHKSRGVSKTSIHLYRHRFAKDYAKATDNAFKLQRLLMHKTIQMATEYVALYGNDVKEDYNSVNPLEQFHRGKRKRIILFVFVCSSIYTKTVVIKKQQS